MSQPNAGDEAAATAYHPQPGGQGPRPSRRSPRRLRRAGRAAAVAALLVAIIQWFAADTDYQYAYLASGAVIAVTVLVVLYQLHRLAAAGGHPWRIPAATGATLAVAVTLFRFDSFSGEMLPQFEWRFGGDDTPPLVTEVAKREPDAAAGETVAGASDRPAEVAAEGESRGTVGDAALELDDPSPPGPSAWESLGFLGNNRTGVIEDRLFAVPESPGEAEVLWTIGIGQGWASFAVAEQLAITLEQRDRRECLTAYRVADGSLAWIHDHEAYHEHPLGGGGPRTTPTIHDGHVYAQGATGRVWCVELLSGRLQWSADLLELAGWSQTQSEEALPWGRAGSPLLVDGLCVLPFGAEKDAGGIAAEGRSLIALDAETGEVRWTAGKDQISYASPQLLTLAGTRQVVNVNEDTISGHQVADGNVLWTFRWRGNSNADANCAAVVPAGPDRFLIGKGYSGGSALAEVAVTDEGKYEARERWSSHRILKTKFTHACVDDGVAYALSNGTLEAVSVEDAKRLWMQGRGNRYGQGQMLLADDVLVIQDEMGDVAFAAADPERYRELSRLPALSSKTWNIPTLAGRYLLVRNDEQAVCYLLPERG